MTLIEDEKAERERQRQAEEREEMELMQREAERREAVRQRALERDRADAANSAATQEWDQAHQNEIPVQSSRSGTSPIPSSPPKSVATPPQTKGSATTLERTGLCVVCQDEEANIAIVDCGWVYFLFPFFK